ncbi:MAG: GvpL/GvpF family gas vesicle protein [Devosia sp.]|nr:GvpL/GvpF family gas vesicle protein [Devosia sp.]
MMIYVYAITDQPDEPLPQQPGLDDAQLAQLAWRDIGAVVSMHEASHWTASPEAVWRHEQVVEALMERRAVLPARFGTLFPTSRQLTERLSETYPGLARDLDLVRGQVEIGLRFSPREPDRPGLATTGDPRRTENADPVSGTAYLLAKVASERAQRSRREQEQDIARKFYATLAASATAGRLDAPSADHPGASAAFLVPRDGVASFRAVIGQLASSHPELAMLCTGPWPPYSFVGSDAKLPATGRGTNGL